MDYFRKYLSGPQGAGAPTGAETIERLCDRVQSSTLLEDRRDAVRALKSLSKKFRLEVGTQGMEILINVLKTDTTDSEILGYALETLCNVMSNEPPEEDDETGPPATVVPDDLGSQFTEMFIKNPENMVLLLDLLGEYDFHVRWPTVRLLTILLGNKGRDLQESILIVPQGIPKLMDLLSDSREIIRNDGLLLLIQLTKGNANIQKIVVFENAFEKLLEIIFEEGSSDGGIVVEDCLLLLLNLLKNNTSNQTFFKEGSFIQRLPPYFELEPADESPQGGWSAQKVTNIHLMLQLIRTLVSPNNPQQQTSAAQKTMNHCGLLKELCTILMASGVPADVLTETINTVSEVIRGNEDNQEYFASVMAPSSPPRPAIVVLLMSMVNEKQPFYLRCAVLYCFQSFLYKNELGQSQIVQTLLPSTADATSISAGQLLCGGLFSPDSLSTWFAAVAMLHSIQNNATQKEQLLRVQLATSLGNPPVSLLQQCCNILAQGGIKLQTRVGLLIFLCHWLAKCPIAVTHFLHNPNNVPFLISQVSASEGDENEMLVQGLCAFLLGICVLFNQDQVENSHRQQMKQIIEKRIGLEMFSDKLSQVAKHEFYSRSAKQPQLSCKQPSEVLFDYVFTRLFKTLENDVVKALSPEDENELSEKQKKATLDQHNNIVAQYKELIREQDTQLNSLKNELSSLQNKHQDYEKQVQEMEQEMQLLKDQNSLLKAQKGISNGAGDPMEILRLHQEIESYKKNIEESNHQIEKLRSELTVAEAKAVINGAVVESAEGNSASGDSLAMQAAIQRLTGELEEAKKKTQQKDEEVKLYRGKLDESTKQMTLLRESMASGNGRDSAGTTALLTERNSLAARVTELETKTRDLEEQLSNVMEEKSVLYRQLGQVKEENGELEDKVKRLEEESLNAEEEKRHAVEEYEAVKKDQDDLLLLLSDQENKIKEYKTRLKALGETVEDDDDDDDDDLGDDVDVEED